MQLFKTLVLTAGLGFALAASAQWQWVDKDGNKVFSDRAPPSDIPDKNILRRPGGNRPAPPPVAVDAAATPAAPQAKGTDPALEEKKKLAEEAEAAKKKAEEARIAAARAENCTRSRQAKASFDSGLRIARTNAQGEREILDDAARAAETKRLQEIIAADCR
ncbi:DUF4124 domain-containing protein [Rhodoferax koreense]|uniref:DUF4124 domain-containing protein n=1 Tax=Rhodoferax koreensis TaxID=1842727 RepID=A0A1P8JWC1_9BURK|nr:DUF4124 domain-containing protein [Rhodoferax koreense]APW38066.1 DUF4124 domain-containing protein [Rhodoferax koreense]